MSAATLYVEDFAVGQEWVSQGRTITESDLVSFAAWSWDTNEVHTDEVAASRGRFGTRIAHGMLGAAIAMGLVSRLGVFEGSSIALLGIDEWRFERPLLIGETVRCRVTILSVRPTSAGDAGILDRRLELVSSDGTVLQHGRIGLMVACRPASP
ncbi:MaoC/PaaZ C-terminal domain-containing protein [Aeromicrobium sp. CTD01-1L150]|uniref:MaoC/PaaZ C-terminal domain-containing protein n=1 Tax=Aeromicrobium sp. CTD01-1L150 TaxID=3341830 RepID=UPI0035C1D16B